MAAFMPLAFSIQPFAAQVFCYLLVLFLAGCLEFPSALWI